MGRFKNSADGRASLIPTVRSMGSDRKGVTEIAREIKVPRATVATWICRNNLGSPRSMVYSERAIEARGGWSEVPAKWRPNNPDIISEMDHLAGPGRRTLVSMEPGERGKANIIREFGGSFCDEGPGKRAENEL